uniref:Uncharacterized protein n=1 Tax=Clostridium botulinum TaxID=1491 RepID=A0A0A0UV95_CLOBO|nr:hypothetical protein [Clostridium botulinum]AIW54604.1 hypothetical protein [Clostridium botulinum]AIW54724.1 hypothetical protein [Clostridium botulinum]AIW54786.1 hypothetical protein [Clostridium botulinum]AIW54853.1 hypothetical protein [Clostridium botulinum]
MIQKSRLDKNKVKDLYVLGYIASEIADILKQKTDTVKKCISRNFKDYVSVHEERRNIKRDIRKAVRNDSNKYIGTAELIKWNRNSFSSNHKGDLVFDKNNGIAPIDLPTYYKAPISAL